MAGMNSKAQLIPQIALLDLGIPTNLIHLPIQRAQTAVLNQELQVGDRRNHFWMFSEQKIRQHNFGLLG